MVIEHCGKQIVRRADCVKITRKMKVYILHRYNLRISAARSAALYPEHRSERGFPQRYYGIFPQSSHPVGKTYCGCSFALPRGGRCNSRNQYKLSVFSFAFRKKLKVYLRLCSSVLFKVFFINSRAFCNFRYMLRLYRLCNLYIAFIHTLSPSCLRF